MPGFVGAAPMLERLLEEELARAGLAAALDDEAALRRLCVPASDGTPGDLDRAAAWLGGVPVGRIRAVIQILTLRFHLRNKAEQLEIARINRERERSATPESPRTESIAEAVATLARRGASLDQLLATLGRLDIQPTLTAHPTEARRRAVLRKQARMAETLADLERPDLLDAERAGHEAALRRVLLELAVTDEVRSQRLDAIDEVRNGLHYLTGSIWNVVPTLYEDLRRAIERHYAQELGAEDGAKRLGSLPTVLRYRSWIGGDRDGNPKVTPEVTRQTLRSHRRAAVELYAAALEQLRLALTVSTRRRPASTELLEAIRADASVDVAGVDDTAMRHLEFEPYRVRVLQMQARLRACVDDPKAYTAAAFEGDLGVIAGSLEHAGLDRLCERGPLADLLVRVRAFGLDLAALDVRQHSDVHEAAVDELLRVAGVTERYAELDEGARLEILRRELASPRPLAPHGASLSEATRVVLDTLRVIRAAIDSDPGSFGSYVVSMTHKASDILETLLLAKEAGLYRPAFAGDPGASLIDVAPLFETIDDLDRAAGLLRAVFAEPLYLAHLERRGRMQEVMLGYSDSNKDGGYWVANWLLHRAQGEVSRACAEAGVQVRLFHGRGGSIGRGGGRANRAILAAPRESRTGRIRFTEQGEVISFRYAMASIAHRHLEQIVSAMLLATHDASGPGDASVDAGGTPTGAPEVMERIAAASMESYRALIGDPAFWGWYTGVTPIAHISRLPLASRPVMRSPGTADFGRLRAIPWVFAWTQIRATAPGWFGVGSGLRAALDRDASLLERFREWNANWPIFGAIIANAEQEMARARLGIATRYAAAAGMARNAPGDGAHPILDRLRDEFDRTSRLVLDITGSARLLDRRRVIQDLIEARNPDTDALNLCQIELMTRWRDAGGAASDASGTTDPELQAALLASVNGIAAAMQSTG
ncbi:MAG: phosphoenolpyruvate carboxylase [Phycisphaerales bacterium]|nr:phosphoenolpyruvate carboxylase [Phycisphaerales bacterium]